jgi:A/G-specific adenine glycosylase
VKRFSARLLAWHGRHGRHDLPWQHPRSAYRVWVSEIMLQQTRVATAVPYYLRFVAALPDIRALAAADADTVLALWSGLGYYSRARNLHRAAKLCAERHAGELPLDFDALVALPGIGRSTAGAILALAHGLPYPILDGNVRRVLCRHRGLYGWPGSTATQKALWQIAERALPKSRIASYTQALMDLGAMVCVPANPECMRCPLRGDCIAHSEDLVAILPERGRSKPLPERDTYAILARDSDGRVLLQRRPQVGVWASLWSLPEADSIASSHRWLRHHASVNAHEALPTIRHVFSHYRLRIHPLVWHDARVKHAIGDTDELRWLARDEFAAIALPAPIRKLLEGLDS